MEAIDETGVAAVPGLFVGPGEVRHIGGRSVLVDVEGSLQHARLAVAFPYSAEVGDTVLVLGHDDAFYVVGVIEGKGLTRLDVPGDLEICAGGNVSIQARASVNIGSSRITMRADRLDLAIRTVREHIVNLYRRVEGTIRTVAGRERTTIEHQSTLHARRIVRKASDDVIVDGRQIKLG